MWEKLWNKQSIGRDDMLVRVKWIRGDIVELWIKDEKE